MRTRNTFVIAILSLAFLAFTEMSYAQNDALLQQYSTDELYEVEAAHNVSGEWTGTEIQYDETGSYIKYKFDIVFNFEQDGNKISGTSYIKDKRAEDVGYMNIRGYVIGDKLHFEEYELTAQQWETPNRVWCFRTGELDLSQVRNKQILQGDYDSYAAYDYRPCRDYCHTVVQKNATQGSGPVPAGLDELEEKEDNLVVIAPSPFRDQTTLTYSLSENAKVKLDVFDLSGRKVVGLHNGQKATGKHTATFLAGDNPPGSYLVRLVVDDKVYTEPVVLMR